MRKKAYEVSVLVCPECGTKMFVPRGKGQKRSVGHIKDMWCYKCKEKRKFVEGGSYE